MDCIGWVSTFYDLAVYGVMSVQDLVFGVCICVVAHLMVKQKPIPFPKHSLWKPLYLAAVSISFYMIIFRLKAPPANVAAYYSVVATACVLMAIPYIYMAKGLRRWRTGSICMGLFGLPLSVTGIYICISEKICTGFLLFKICSRTCTLPACMDDVAKAGNGFV